MKIAELFYLALFLILLPVFFSGAKPVMADEKNGGDFFKLSQRLIKYGFDRDRIEEIYSSRAVCFDPQGVALFFAHSESSLDYSQFLSASSMEKASSYMKRHRNDLERAEKKYGVDKTIITAILLVETRLGTYLGKRGVLNTLSTMAALSDPYLKEKLWRSIHNSKKLDRQRFDEKVKQKSQWAFRELVAFLKYSARESLDPLKITGSYAGALGISQFMPSNALTLARDGNNDGMVNLFEHSDAICSIANYLRHFGWKPTITRQRAHKILYKYNHSNYYVDTLLKISEKLKG